MAETDARREELEARNARLRSQIDSMLSDLRRRTTQLGEKRDEAAQRTTEVTSRDGLVTVTVDAVGTVRELTLAAKAFERTTPERLGHTITSVLREAAGRAQQGLQETFGPTTEEGPEIADVVSGAPGFKDLAGCVGPLVPPPDPAVERARQASESSSAAARQNRSRPARSQADDHDDEPPSSFMVRSSW